MKPLDATALHVMVQLAGSQLRLLKEQALPIPLYRDLAASGVREYQAACRVPFRVTAEERAAYEHEIVRELVKIDETS